MKENSVENQLAKVQDHPEKHWLKIALFSLLGLALIGGLIFAAIKIGVPTKPRERACTEEAKICPDGSAVGRTGPNCEFAPCPAPATKDETANWKIYTNTKYEYSFRYPEEVIITTRVEELPGNEREREISSTCCIGVWKDKDSREILFGLEALEENRSLEDYKEELTTREWKNISGMNEIAFLNKKALVYYFATNKMITVINNKTRYDFLFTDKSDGLIDQILSTFRFLE